MPKIRVDLEATVINGQALTFKSPADCSQITGLIIYYPVGDSTTSKTFQFADAHGNNVGGKSLFANDVLVKVLLDTELNRAYVQNADTNAYLEGKLAEKYSPDNKPTPEAIGAAKSSHKHTKSEITDFPTSMTPTSHTHKKSEITDFPTSMTPTSHTHKKSEITDFPTSMAPTTHTHKKSEITDFPTSMTPTAHNQAASTITAGTFAGQVVANASGQAVGTSLLRNSKLVNAETNPTVNGEICWTYE